MYHYIFFDLDGTLTDSKEGILNSLRYAFDKLGEPVPPESTLIKFIGPPLQDSFAEFCGFSAERAAEAIAAFRERYEPVGKFENMAAPGMADLCARLKARAMCWLWPPPSRRACVCPSARSSASRRLWLL